jgi:DNA (cytosine-5)-methyltransferase 1
MKLYEEILFLQHYFKHGKFIVENVIPYYEPLISAQKRDRHLYWSNFTIPKIVSNRNISGIVSQAKNELNELCKIHEIDLFSYKGNQSLIKIARNLVDYEAGKTIFATALGILENKNHKQSTLF